MIGQIMTNEFSVANTVKVLDLSEEIARIVLVIGICMLCIINLITLIVGFGGIRQIGGKGKKEVNVVLATIVLVLKIIGIVICTYFVFMGKMENQKVLYDCLFIFFLIPYIMCAKRV
ncbi:MAG: hypothetical protein MR304_12020 [Eubacterium sp.]|nr:hypothetical protein [Eubacterium sp.]